MRSTTPVTDVTIQYPGGPSDLDDTVDRVLGKQHNGSGYDFGSQRRDMHFDRLDLNETISKLREAGFDFYVDIYLHEGPGVGL